MNAYSPRRCGARWLDGDCPKEILAIIDHGHSELERFDVIYAEVLENGRDKWLTYFCLNEHGSGYHGELKAHQVAAYRYRMKHRYTTWSGLPGEVQDAVRVDLGLCVDCGAKTPVDEYGRPTQTVAGRPHCDEHLADYLEENGVTT